MRAPHRSRARRIGAGLVLFAAVVVSAVGPSRLAAAVTTAVASGQPDFLPEPTPIRVTSPTLRISDLQGATPNSPIPVAGGGESPSDTILLTFSTIQLDDLSITQDNAGSFALAITNSGSADQAAQIGGTGETVRLWGTVRSLSICLSAATLSSIVSSNAGALGSLVGGLLGDLGPLTGAGPCLPIAQVLPVIGALLSAGVALPGTIPVTDLDIDVYALQVDASAGQQSLYLPTGVLTAGPG